MMIKSMNGVVGWIVISEELGLNPEFQTTVQEVYTTREEAEAAASEVNEVWDGIRFCVNPVWIPNRRGDTL
jgi:hypothetical protein